MVNPHLVFSDLDGTCIHYDIETNETEGLIRRAARSCKASRFPQFLQLFNREWTTVQAATFAIRGAGLYLRGHAAAFCSSAPAGCQAGAHKWS